MNIQLSKVVSQVSDRFKSPEVNRLAYVVSSAGVNFIDFNCCNYRKLFRQKFRQVTGQQIQYTTISFCQFTQWKLCQPFCADSAHWRFYNNKSLVRHAILIPQVDSVMFSQTHF